MGFFAFFGSLMIGGIVGYLAEKWDLTHNGVLASIVIALGGVILLFMVRVMFGLSLWRPGDRRHRRCRGRAAPDPDGSGLPAEEPAQVALHPRRARLVDR